MRKALAQVKVLIILPSHQLMQLHKGLSARVLLMGVPRSYTGFRELDPGTNDEHGGAALASGST